jgi:ATP-GRASP peptide maturase of grasp-with-spasm system
MILVLSQDVREMTTEEVVDWIRALGGDCLRLNADDLTSPHPFRMEVGRGQARLHFRLAGRAFTDADVRAVWLRRWARSGALGLKPVTGLEAVSSRVAAHLGAEVSATARALFTALSAARWVTHPGDASLNKIEALRAAAAAGLEVPPTLVTNDRAAIEDFRREHGRIITKSVGEAEIFSFFGKSYGLYTAEAGEADVAALPESIFPTLVQARVEKAFEIRAFYLAGDFYAAAIFSQADAQTAEDFRRYNTDAANRTVPYRLPAEVAGRLRAFMDAVGLNSGSIDLIRTPDGRYVFLEVNPAGQFGMVSHPCNYRLEKKMAEHLIRLDAHD